MTPDRQLYMRLYRERNKAKIAEKNRALYLRKREAIKQRVKARYEAKKPEILAQQKEWRARTAEKQRQNRTNWARRNREKVRKIAQEVYHRNKAKHFERTKKWQKANPEKVRAMSRRYHQQHPEIRRANQAKRRTGGKSLQRTIVTHLIQKQAGQCHWCGRLYGEAFELDHVIPIAKGGGNDASNLVLACLPCNRKKGARMPAEFAGALL